METLKEHNAMIWAIKSQNVKRQQWGYKTSMQQKSLTPESHIRLFSPFLLSWPNNPHPTIKLQVHTSCKNSATLSYHNLMTVVINSFEPQHVKQHVKIRYPESTSSSLRHVPYSLLEREATQWFLLQSPRLQAVSEIEDIHSVD